MQDHSYLVLAQSGRFLAKNLQYTGRPIWVADCFGDSDTLSSCEKWLALPSLEDSGAIETLLAQLPSDKHFHLICGNGVENFYPALNNLPSNIHLIGNSIDTIRQIKTAKLFFQQLKQLKILHPETRFDRPETNGSWLTKSMQGMGGVHIRYLHDSADVTDCYFQRYHSGISGSALILANGISAQLLSLNRHFYSATDTIPFRLTAIDNSLTLSNQQTGSVNSAIANLTVTYGLVGLNSIDFIIDQDGNLLITEINPRPSASVELLLDSAQALQLHLQACKGQPPKTGLFHNSDYKACLIYHFAPDELTVRDSINWPEHCQDIPQAETNIKQQEIVCTSVIKNCHYSHNMHRTLTSEIFVNLK